MTRKLGGPALGLLLVLSTTSCGGGGGGGASAPPPAQNAGNTIPVFSLPAPILNAAPPVVSTSVTFARTSVNSGGGATSFKFDEYAFKRQAPNLSEATRHVRDNGQLVFDAKAEVTGGSAFPGLGPVFNNNACRSCHVRDGRGSQPPNGKSISSMLLRLSVPGADEHGGPLPVPGFGGQLQDRAVEGRRSEGTVAISQTSTNGLFGDGSTFSLAQPVFLIANPYIPLPAGVMISARVAPQMAGLGLIEAIPEALILSKADEHDADGDGISGRANMVWDVLQNRQMLGRFGWKAGQPNLIQQAAAAFRNDMGVTNALFPTEAAAGQEQDDRAGDDPELSNLQLDQVTFYLQTQAVPGRRSVDLPEVLRGEELFYEAKCTSCHTPFMVTGLHASARLTAGAPASINEVEGQAIQPFSDFLLHDMGPGLADNRPEGMANGQEWRTPPLWGIGLFQTTNSHTTYLHDGRARNLSEAILWHGGEAEASKNHYASLSEAERAYVVAFLSSL